MCHRARDLGSMPCLRDVGGGQVTVSRTRTCRHTGPPKTLRSHRVVGLPADVLARIIPSTDSGAPLFSSLTRPGTPMDEGELHRLWHRTLVRAQVRPRPIETLRHSGISQRLSRGEPLLAVAALAGHSPQMMLTRYAKWLPGATADYASTSPQRVMTTG